MRVGPQRMIATTGDHPSPLRDSPPPAGGKTVPSLRDSHSGPAIGTAFGRSPLARLSDRLRLQTALPFAQPAAK